MVKKEIKSLFQLKDIVNNTKVTLRLYNQLEQIWKKLQCHGN